LATGAVISTQIVNVNRFSLPGSNVDPHMPASITDVVPPNHLRGYESGTLRPRPLINFRILGNPFPTGSSVRLRRSYISDLVIADSLHQNFGKTNTLASGFASDPPKLFRTFNCEGLCLVEPSIGVVLARIRPIGLRTRHRV